MVNSDILQMADLMMRSVLIVSLQSTQLNHEELLHAAWGLRGGAISVQKR
uniref:Uncharacterized protein n=1 Tax=Rhizophora mucronata TaxID=61149 RepID=A0A2P2QCJ0_RHIMU